MNKKDKIDELLYELFDKENTKIPDDFTEFIKREPHKKVIQNKSFIVKKCKVAGIIVVFMSIMATGIVSANKVSDILNSIFNLNDINLNNNNIVESINKNEHIQSIIDKDIILNDDVSLSIDYITLDSSNIYILFNAKSKNRNINEYRMNILDLKLSGDNIQFYDLKQNNSSEKSYYVPGWKKIQSESDKTKELFFLYSNKIPEMEKLKIEFSSIFFYNEQNNEKFEVKGNYQLDIILNEILKKQEKEVYDIYNKKISDFYISSTGTYCIMETENNNDDYTLFVNNIEYKSSKLLVFYDIEKKIYKYLLNYEFDIDKKNKNEINSLILKNNNNLETIIIK